MTDEAAPASEQDSQPDDTAAPDGTPAPDSTESHAQPDNWEQRFKDTQAEYTRVSQTNSQLNQIIAAARQGEAWAINELGFDLADDDEEDDDEGTPEYHDPRVDQLLQAEQARQEAAELDSLENYVETEIDKLAKSASYDLSDDEVDLIFGALAPGDDGNPDVERAFKKVTGLRDAHVKSYVAGKLNKPQAPSGSSASHQPDLDDPEQRRQYIASRMGSP